MNRITATRARLEQADGLPGLLAAAYDAFEDLLAVLRYHQERAGGSFAAFVLSAAEAGNGRDWIASAPSMPRVTPIARRDPAGDLLACLGISDVASALAATSQALAGRLSEQAAADNEDRTACARAADHAARIHWLLGGTEQP